MGKLDISVTGFYFDTWLLDFFEISLYTPGQIESIVNQWLSFFEKVAKHIELQNVCTYYNIGYSGADTTSNLWWKTTTCSLHATGKCDLFLKTRQYYGGFWHFQNHGSNICYKKPPEKNSGECQTTSFKKCITKCDAVIHVWKSESAMARNPKPSVYNSMVLHIIWPSFENWEIWRSNNTFLYTDIWTKKWTKFWQPSTKRALFLP